MPIALAYCYCLLLLLLHIAIAYFYCLLLFLTVITIGYCYCLSLLPTTVALHKSKPFKALFAKLVRTTVIPYNGPAEWGIDSCQLDPALPDPNFTTSVVGPYFGAIDLCTEAT